MWIRQPPQAFLHKTYDWKLAVALPVVVGVINNLSTIHLSYPQNRQGGEAVNRATARRRCVQEIKVVASASVP